MVAWLLMSSSACTGAPDEVPVALVGWSDTDAAWLSDELTRWLGARERVRCDGAGGLRLEQGALEATVHFAALTRTVSRSGAPDELFRYQVAVAAEELARATWETPPPPDWSLFARAEGAWVADTWNATGGLGISRALAPSFRLELAVTAGALFPHAIDEGVAVRGVRVEGALTASWLPVHVDVFRLGLRGSVRGGVLLVSVDDARSTQPMLSLGGGVTAGLETRRLSVLVYGEAGGGVVAPRVEREGSAVFTLRSFGVTAGLQAGVRW